MMGAGPDVFAVWAYALANTGSTHQVELNPKLLCAVIGCRIERIEAAIEFLCAPDVKSKSKIEEGRRLVKVGEFEYFVPNHEAYTKIKDENGRRQYMRQYMAEYRGKKQ